MKVHPTTIKYKTTIHILKISREYFKKFTASLLGMALDLHKKDKIRKRNRVKALLKLQSGMKSATLRCNEQLLAEGNHSDLLYIAKSGNVNIMTGGHQIFVAMEKSFVGEHTLLMGCTRNTTATCNSDGGCVVTRMLVPDFRQLMDASPLMRVSRTDANSRRQSL
jgi:CRP-like cAMP-binding protein